MTWTNLLNRSAFITGAAQGLGKAFTEALLQKGAKVCFTDIQTEKGLLVEQELKRKYGKDNVFFLECDVSSSENLTRCFQSAVSTLGNIDLMVNNAGIADEIQWKKMLSINLIGAIEGSMLAIEHMRKDKGGNGGKIINISSAAGLTGTFFAPAYCASKFGLVGYHRSWASNPYNNQLGLQFGCLCPAFTDTAIIQFSLEKFLYYKDAQTSIHHLGIMKVETVVEAFLKLVEAENLNEDNIVTVNLYTGIQYYKKKSKKSNL